jgi:hypothetical protein
MIAAESRDGDGGVIAGSGSGAASAVLVSLEISVASRSMVGGSRLARAGSGDDPEGPKESRGSKGSGGSFSSGLSSAIGSSPVAAERYQIRQVVLARSGPQSTLKRPQ